MNSRALVVPFSLLLLAGCVTEQKYDKQVQQTQKAVALDSSTRRSINNCNRKWRGIRCRSSSSTIASW